MPENEIKLPIPINRDQLMEFCKRWRISELSFFGSILRNSFRMDSDVDILVSFLPDSNWGLLDHVMMEDELSGILGRKVDLVTRRSIEASKNWIRRNEILSTVKPYYVS